jgi:AhpD family alkylhydroperoxidase
MYTLNNLLKLPKLKELAPEVTEAFWAFDKLAYADGAIPRKYKELIAVGVALTTHCPYCIELHRQSAMKAGASEKELAETVMVAAALRASGAVTIGTHALPATD